MNFVKNRDSLLKLIDEIVGRNFISSNFPPSVCLSWGRTIKYGVVDVEDDKCFDKFFFTMLCMFRITVFVGYCFIFYC